MEVTRIFVSKSKLFLINQGESGDDEDRVSYVEASSKSLWSYEGHTEEILNKPTTYKEIDISIIELAHALYLLIEEKEDAS